MEPIVEVPATDRPPVPLTRNPIRLSRTPAEMRTPPPEFGSSNRAVLAAAGYSAAEIDALVAEGIVPDKMRAAPAD